MSPDNSRTDKRSIAQNAFFNVLCRLLNVVFPMISVGYVARVLTPDGMGRYAAVANNVSYFVLLGSLGIGAYAIRETAKRKEDREARAKLVSELLVINTFMTTVAVIVFTICLLFLPLFRAEQLLYLVCGFTIVVNYINIDWFFQGNEDYKFIALRSLAVKSLGLLAVFIFVHVPEDLYKYALISVFSSGIYHLINLIHMSRSVHLSFRKIDLAPHLKSIVYLALCTVSTELYARMDITMLGIMDHNSSVAYYSYSQKIIDLIITTVIAITAVFLPKLSFYYSNDKDKFNDLVRFGVNMMALVSLPMCFGLVSVASPLMSLWLGNGYQEASLCLMVLAFMIPLKCIGDIICYQVMMCAGKEFYLMIAYTITMAINFGNNMILIPRYGALGASVASLLSEIIVFVLVYVQARKYQAYEINRRNIVVTLISTIAMTTFVAAIQMLVDDDKIKLFGGALAGVIVFFLLSILLKNTFMTDELLSTVLKKRRQG